jgi:hypothetical protein
MKKRHKKEKQVEPATSAEQQHHEGSGDGAHPIVVEEHVPVDSREGEKRFPPERQC